MTKRRYTLELIEKRRTETARRAKEKADGIRRRWEGIVAPPDSASPMAMWLNRAEAAYTLYDGVMTGYKLCRRLGGLFRKRKK